MKAIVFPRHGGVDELRLDELPEPDVAPNEVKVRVRAVALNAFDIMMLEGSTGLRVPLPMVPCGDFAGEIVAAGREAPQHLAVGTRVTGYPVLPGIGMMGEVARGAACEFVSVDASCALPMPDGLSFESAASLPVAYGTAFRMMGVRGKVSAGERVLVLGATGGVGVACVQLAKMAGAEVIACGGGEWKLTRLKEIGADHTVDTSDGEFLSKVRQRFGKPAYDGSGDGGVDVLVNYIGGDTWAAGLKTVRRHGRILVCGATAGHAPATDLRYIWSFEQSVVGSNGWTRDDQLALMDHAAGGRLDPVIHSVRPIEEYRAAMAELIDRKVFGKSVITL